MKFMLIYLMLCLSIFSCKKDDDAPPMEQEDPPPITAENPPPITAENTFSCNINGELFIPEDFSSFPNNYDGYKAFFIDQTNSFFSLFRNQDMSMFIYIYIILMELIITHLG
ncbi:hypothetical protein [Patiriisocius sp. Uisw_017]|uniref:hypothetical protein n=1 Tax=Patiriisocius sp. Uisw_017 TaxID=3230968 RepID=UPI0039E95124